jgi:hypothetical protein
MGYKPVFGHNLLPCTDSGRPIFEVDPYQQRVLREMKDAVGVLGKDDDQIPGLLQELAAPALPTDGLSPGVLLLTLPPIGGCQGEQQQSEHHMHAHRPRCFLGRMRQTPLLLTLFDTAILTFHRI